MNIKEIISQMTLEEKAGLCSGYDFWHTKGVERLGVPQMMVSDGPHGLRKQDLNGDHLGVNDSIKAVCFPAGCTTAASFDRGLVEKLGKILGNECQAEGVAVILGPAVNIKRSPLCGRNFEYYSEDPYLAGETAKSFIDGVQSQNIGTSLKHFLANNQEHRRMSSSSEVDDRTLREIYLPAFETAVKEAKPWTVMCSYNRINGVYAAENKKYLTDVLIDEWGFDGFVVSDWGAINNRVEDLKAGLDLEMPASFGFNDKAIVKAVENGSLDIAILDRAIERILNILYKFENNRNKDAVFNLEADHNLAREIASECMVLLKNEDILPLKKESNAAFIGYFAEKPRYQGGGSSHINSFKTESALEMAKDYNVTYAKGYDTSDFIDEELIAEAVETAKNAEVAVIFAGLPDTFESEGFDRSHMNLPECQNALINAVAEVNSNIVIVLHNGSPVEMPWIDKVKGILEVYLGGQAVGGATIQVLYGDVNPSGHLAETFPIKLQDNPSYLYYKGEGDKVEYREGVFVGYRYYNTKEMDVLFPFGYGLSYTTFEISNIKLDKADIMDSETLTVTVDVKNTGSRKGKEVVQLYVMPKGGEIIRPTQELKGYEKIELEPSETKTVTFKLDKRSFAYYDIDINDWAIETGTYDIAIGNSSRNISVKSSVKVTETTPKKMLVTRDTTIGDIIKNEKGRKLIEDFIHKFALSSNDEENAMGESTSAMAEAMLRYMPLRGVISFGDGSVNLEQCDKLIEELNSL